MDRKEIVWIVYTTKYRKGGEGFKRAAETLSCHKQSSLPNMEILCEAVESKTTFLSTLRNIQKAGKSISELHFIGHSGMYGPMFGTTSWPEQFSPYEWRTMEIPFSEDGEAWFHACRSARWFAPFFSRTFDVPANGYTLYTTFSGSPDKFSLDKYKFSASGTLYVIGCPGKKSHGLFGSVIKYSGIAKPEKMKHFIPQTLDEDSTYNSVAALYDRVFKDISIRTDEWKWLTSHLRLDGTERVLDIGSGNGAFLRNISDSIASGNGVDRSSVMVELARSHSADIRNLKFFTVDSPKLPFDDNSFDVAVSLMSFRYLDWDPIMSEIHRVLSPKGKLLVVDMVAAPARFIEFYRLLLDKAKNYLTLLRNPGYRKALKRMVNDASWKEMLKHNPMRAQHELQWYFESRFPGRKIEILNIGMYSRILAFDSGALNGKIEPLSYP